MLRFARSYVQSLRMPHDPMTGIRERYVRSGLGNRAPLASRASQRVAGSAPPCKTYSLGAAQTFFDSSGRPGCRQASVSSMKE